MLQMTTALQIPPLVHPRVLSLTRTHMKTINPTEELVIATILTIGEAIGFITTHLLVPGISLILAGLGWRPPTRPEVEPPSTTPEESQKAFCNMAMAKGLVVALDNFFPSGAGADQAIANYINDIADDYSHEVPTAEERSPSLRRRSKR
jgi:hypothetical protein